MGRKRTSDSDDSSSQDNGNSEAISINSNNENSSRKRLKKRYKKSHNYKLLETEISEDEIEYMERKKHKHKHKKHKRETSKHRNEHSEESELNKHHKRRHGHHSSTHEIRGRHRKYPVDESEKRTSHRKRERQRHNDDVSSRDMEYEIEQQRSKWNDENEESIFHRPIKTEPISDDSDTLMDEPRPESNRNINNHNNNRKVKKEKIDGKEKWGKDIPEKVKEEKPDTAEKEKVNMGLSGKLAEDTNTYNGIVIKYSQPPEARKPKRRWRWYIFKGDEELPFLPLHRQSAYLIGRERKVADIPTDHPSCSKQHAVFQYRLVSYERPDGTIGRTVKPYILDLESANGTYVNNRRIDPKCYVELFEKDVVKFGYSSREYVLLHEASKGSDDDLPDHGAEGMDLSPVSLLRSQ